MRLSPIPIRRRNWTLVHDYPDEHAAGLGLLAETVSLLRRSSVDFAVIGGWLPYLFNAAPISHPGTFDVDILLNERTPRAAFESGAEILLGHGYLRAPKNQFQLHRLLSVRGEQFVYHVDFLHRKYADDTDDMIRHWGKFQSIAGPGTDIIFTENERTTERIVALPPNGPEEEIQVPFCSEVGFISAKGRSATTAKRTRDAFDVFLVVCQSRDRERLIRRSSELLANTMFQLSMRNLYEGFTTGRLAERAIEHLRDQEPGLPEPEATVREAMRAFFQNIDVPAKLAAV